MKKSRIIVPAMAVIAFSTAASIAGSVAWFTASRTVTISGGSYAVVKTTSNLDATLSGGVGTDVTGKTVNFTGKLTDGSFNHNLEGGKKIYVPNGKEGDAFALSEVALDDADLASKLERTTITIDTQTYKVYTAATFNIEFDMDFGSGQPDAAIFLDTNASSFSVGTNVTPVTGKGFRMAFVPVTVPSGSAGFSKVYADLQESGKCSYVSGTSDKDGTAYDAAKHDLIDSEYSAVVPTTSIDPDDLAARNDYLGTIKSQVGHVKMKYTVVVWFEGTDENIVNRQNATDYQTVTATLAFTAVDVVESVNP